MASSTSNKIMIQTNEESAARPVFDDILASEAITPGEILAISAGKFIPHGSANGIAKPLRVAVESAFISDPTAAAIDHDYATNETVNYVFPQPGDMVYVFIKASEALTTGVTYLASDGAGALQAITPDASTVDGAVLAQAAETVTIGVARARAKVRVL